MGTKWSGLIAAWRCLLQAQRTAAMATPRKDQSKSERKRRVLAPLRGGPLKKRPSSQYRPPCVFEREMRREVSQKKRWHASVRACKRVRVCDAAAPLHVAKKDGMRACESVCACVRCCGGFCTTYMRRIVMRFM